MHGNNHLEDLEEMAAMNFYYNHSPSNFSYAAPIDNFRWTTGKRGVIDWNLVVFRYFPCCISLLSFRNRHYNRFRVRRSIVFRFQSLFLLSGIP